MPKMESPLSKKQKLGSNSHKSRLGQGIGISSKSKQLIIKFYNYLEIDMKKRDLQSKRLTLFMN
jgi:hypothetical protein